MAYPRKVCSILTIVFAVLLKNTIADYKLRLYCYDQPDNTVKKMIRLKTNGDPTVTGLQAYIVTGNIAINAPTPITVSGCTQTSKMTGYPSVYELEFSAGCDDNGGNAIKVLGTEDYHSVEACGTPVPYLVEDSVTVTSPPIAFHEHYPNPFDIQFAVFEADGWNAPATEVLFGQDIKLRLTYNMGELENGPDNWGTTFHVAFTTHAAATDLVLEVVTPGLGTNIRILGYLAGSEIYQNAVVKRDHAYEMPIPKEYAETSSNANTWLIESRTIKVESFDGRIGVRVISKNGDGSSYVALPDDVLGTSYRPVTLNTPADTDGEVVIVGTTSTTEVTISYNTYTKPSSLFVGGVTVNVASDTQTVVQYLDEYEVLHIKCGDECDELVIVADEAVAVVYGLDAKAHAEDTSNTGHAMTQLTPFKYFHNEFVLTTPTGFMGSFVVQTDDPTNSPAEVSDNAATTTVKPGYPYLSSYDGEQTLSQDVAYYFHSEALTAGADPALLPIPSMAQWGIFNFFYARRDSSYVLKFVGSHIDEITFTTGSVTTSLEGSKLEDQTGYVVTPVPPISGATSNYFTYEVTITITGGDHGLIEFRAEKTWKPFMLFILEETDTFRTSYLPYGVRYPPTNPGSTTIILRPGDGIDNDNDGRVDEEIQNGVDDDGDGSIDEDPALDIVTRATGVYVDTVEVCSDGCRYVMMDGCFYDYYDDDVHFYMEHFVHNQGLADEFDHLYVIETPAFNAWRDVSGNDITFYVYYGMCFGDLDQCENSCRTKRSTDEKWAVSVTLPVVRNGTELIGKRTDSASTNTKPHPCSNNPVFWVPVTLLLLMLLIESGVSVLFVYKRSQFIKLLGY